ncbi:MAG TPA: class I SAM-dependent methyltransferase [Thermoanaerobaculia bacterium]|jgi:SAM-dependent methyltransferase|nr:class I SAM-dependent methyltransferase [Thermoanaerobaculia bacterium]
MPKATKPVPLYLSPYVDARRQGAKGLHALLWPDGEAQRIRFEAIARSCPLAGLRILDAGCGRADLLAYLLERGIVPAHYTGLELLPETIRTARRRKYKHCKIIAGDFVQQPEKLQVGADVVIFCGSLNTLPHAQFYQTLGAAWVAAGQWLAFNFLSSPFWSGEDWLFWHHRDSVLACCRSLGGEPVCDESYMHGDCTVVVRKPGGAE